MNYSVINWNNIPVEEIAPATMRQIAKDYAEPFFIDGDDEKHKEIEKYLPNVLKTDRFKLYFYKKVLKNSKRLRKQYKQQLDDWIEDYEDIKSK